MQLEYKCFNAMIGKLRLKFNDSLAAVAAFYGITPFVIEFPDSAVGAPTQSFLLGKLPPAELEANGNIKPNRMVAWVEALRDGQEEKPRDFAGQIVCCLQAQLYWKTGNPERVNFEALAMAVTDAVATCVQPYTEDNWGAGVVYNGTFACQRGAVEADGKGGWTQILTFTLGFSLYS